MVSSKDKSATPYDPKRLNELVSFYAPKYQKGDGKKVQTGYNAACKTIAERLPCGWGHVKNISQGRCNPSPALAAAIKRLHRKTIKPKPKRPKRHIGHIIFETEAELRAFQGLSMGERVRIYRRYNGEITAVLNE